MPTAITTINSGDLITNSRTDINNNFSSLNTNKIETGVIDTDTSLSANSDAKLPSQKAVKAYVDTLGNVNASEVAKGIVEEATDAETAAGTATGGTGAKLFVTPAKLATLLALYAKVSTFANGVTTKALNDSSASQTIAHGLGKTPLRVRLTSEYVSTTVSAQSIGSFDSSGQHSIYIGLNSAGNGATSTSSSAAIVLIEGTTTGNNQTGVVSVDATNITITWTKNGTPSASSANIFWEAQA